MAKKKTVLRAKKALTDPASDPTAADPSIAPPFVQIFCLLREGSMGSSIPEEVVYGLDGHGLVWRKRADKAWCPVSNVAQL